MPKIKIVGAEKLQAKLKKNMTMNDVKHIVRHNGTELQAKAQRNAPIDTGNLKRSIGLEINDSGLTAESEATAAYAGRHNGTELQAKAQRNAPIDTGNLKRSIGLEINDSGLTAESEATAAYAGYVEYGTRFMNAQPYMKPAFEEQKIKFRNDMKKLMR